MNSFSQNADARVRRRDTETEAARYDLEARTLSRIRTDFARLVFLASTRDYTTGRYYHDGLSRQFSENAATGALAACHAEVFSNLALSPLEVLVEELEDYVRSTHADPGDLICAWQKLEPYRVTIPLECDPLVGQLFTSNVKIALAILQSRHRSQLPGPQSA